LVKLTKLLSQIIKEGYSKNLTHSQYIDFTESKLFSELANPDNALPYKEEESNIWIFNDLYNNKIGVSIEGDKNNGYVKSFFIVKDKKGNERFSYDLDRDKDILDLNSFTIGKDERRSDTIAKIVLNEIIPKHLSSIPSKLTFQMINEYRYNIFEKIADLAKEKYSYLKIQKLPKHNILYLINK